MITATPATANTVTVSAKYEPTSESSFQVGVRRSANHRATSTSPWPRECPTTKFVTNAPSVSAHAAKTRKPSVATAAATTSGWT